MSLYCAIGSSDSTLVSTQLNALLVEALGKLGERKNVLVLPLIRPASTPAPAI